MRHPTGTYRDDEERGSFEILSHRAKHTILLYHEKANITYKTKHKIGWHVAISFVPFPHAYLDTYNIEYELLEIAH